MKKFTIVGAGRCGTTYVAACLNICGIDAPHQNPTIDNLDGNVGYLENTKMLENKIVVCLYRDPVKNIKSLVQTRMIENIYNKTGRPIEDAIKWYIYVYETLLEKADYFFNIENIDLKGLFKIIGYADKYNDILVSSIPKNANTRYRRIVELEEQDLTFEPNILYKELKRRELSQFS